MASPATSTPMSPVPMSPVRSALLDAAYDAAVSGDWARTRMADVARSAGVSRQTLYNEFGSKDALAQAMAMREIEQFIAGTERALDEAHPDDPVQAVGAAALYTLQRAADNPLLKAALTDDTSGLLSFLTTRGEPALAAARSSFERYYSTHWPDRRSTFTPRPPARPCRRTGSQSPPRRSSGSRSPTSPSLPTCPPRSSRS